MEKIAHMAFPNFITLPQTVWDLKSFLGEDTCEYLTLSVYVQKLEPAKWDEIYELLQTCLPCEIKAITHPDTGVMAPHCARCGNPLWFRPCGCHDNLPCTTECEEFLAIYKTALVEHGCAITWRDPKELN